MTSQGSTVPRISHFLVDGGSHFDDVMEKRRVSEGFWGHFCSFNFRKKKKAPKVGLCGTLLAVFGWEIYGLVSELLRWGR